MTTYILHTPASPDRPLEACSVAELAELIECAIDAGDRIDRLAAVDPGRPNVRALKRSETHQLLLLLTA